MLSRVIRAFSYEARTGRLTVAFVNSRIAVYDAVPQEVSDEFFRAEQTDDFFTTRIHDRYRAREVTRRAA